MNISGSSPWESKHLKTLENELLCQSKNRIRLTMRPRKTRRNAEKHSEQSWLVWWVGCWLFNGFRKAEARCITMERAESKLDGAGGTELPPFMASTLHHTEARLVYFGEP